MRTSLANKNAEQILMNGGLDFWQEGTSFSSTYQYVADGWKAGSSTVNSTMEQSTDIPTELVGIVDYSLKVSPDATETVGATTFGVIEQWIEGGFARGIYDDFFVYSFWMKTNKLGTYSVSFRDGNLSAESYVDEIEVTVPSTWKRYTVVVPHHLATQLSFPTDNGRGINATLALLSGTDYETSNLRDWSGAGTNKVTSTNQVNFYDSTSNEIYFTGAMIHKGIEALELFARYSGDKQKDLLFCQRYYEKSYDLTVSPGSNTDEGLFMHSGEIQTNRYWSASIAFKVQKRATPLMSMYDQVGNQSKITYVSASGGGSFTLTDNLTPTSWSLQDFTNENVFSPRIGWAGSMGGFALQWVADSRL